MANNFGPWATSIDAGGNPQLSTFWRQRLTKLVPTSQSSLTLSQRTAVPGAAGVLTGVLPTVRLALAADPQDAAAWPAEKLAGAVKEQLSSIESFYGEYSIQYGNAKAPVNCRFARSGDKWHYAELKNSPEGQTENTSCCDGQLEFTFFLVHPPKGPSSWSGFQLHLPRRESPRVCSRMSAGSRFLQSQPFGCGGLHSQRSGRHEIASGLPDGRTGVRLFARDVPRARVGALELKYDVAVTLDPEHDLLPADIRITESKKTAVSPGWEQRWKVLQYRRILDEKTKGERWFPVSGVLTQGRTGARQSA